MTPIKIPITISPHIVEDKPRGYYILAHSLWKDTRPQIFRNQYAGFYGGSLILTMAHPGKWDSFMKMVIYAAIMLGNPISWLSTVKMTRMGTGVRFYVPGSILLPRASAGAVETMGWVHKFEYGQGDIIYLQIPKINSDVLLGRKELI